MPSPTIRHPKGRMRSMRGLRVNTRVLWASLTAPKSPHPHPLRNRGNVRKCQCYTVRYCQQHQTPPTAPPHPPRKMQRVGKNLHIFGCRHFHTITIHDKNARNFLCFSSFSHLISKCSCLISSILRVWPAHARIVGT